MTSVDVFIPVYNDLRHLPEAVGSAVAQGGVDVRVVISDNASTDGTYEWAVDFASRLPNVSVHRNATNIGLIGNLNRFRDLVTAPYFMLLCSDDALNDVHALDKAARIMEADQSVVSVYCDMNFIDSTGSVLAARRFGRSGRFSGEDTLRRSIIACRNLFGIPLLQRTETVRPVSYPDNLTYTADVYQSGKVAALGNVHHLPNLLINNRYTGNNLTARLLRQSWEQFEQLEEHFGLSLSPLERVRKRCNFVAHSLAKQLFLQWAARRSV